MGLKPRTDRRVAASSMPPASFDSVLRLLRDSTQHALDARDDIEELVARTWRLIQTVRAEPVLAGHFDDLCHEDEVADRRRFDDYRALLFELNQVRQKLQAQEPNLFEGDKPQERGRCARTHWGFDKHVKLISAADNSDTPGQLSLGSYIGTLERYLGRATTDVDDLNEALGRVRDGECLSRRIYQLAQRSGSRSAVWLYRRFSPFDRMMPDHSELDRFVTPIARVLDDGANSLDEQVGLELSEELPRHLERMEAELRARVGTVRSRLALFERFRQRAQWYDRERLREIAQGETRKAELRLTHELAVFLFDSGLNPLTEINVDNNRLDILDPPGRVYVEAKQYSSSSSAKADIIHGVSQIASGFNKLAGTPLEVHEGFLAVFRWDRDGGPVPPLYEMPRELRLGRYRIYPLLIDLASSDASGRNAGTLIQLTERGMHDGSHLR